MAKLTKKEKLDIILTKEFEDRFWLKFDRSVGNEKCWLWTGKPRKNEKKYISTYIKGKENRMDAQKVSLIMKLKEFHKGDAAHREEICRDYKHRCVNPEHLYDGSKSQNRRDENIAGKTITQKDDRRERFQKLIDESTKDEKKHFLDVLYIELST